MAGTLMTGWGAPAPLNPPAPLAAAAPAGTANTAVLRAAAQRAQDLGQPSVAVEILRQLRSTPGVDRVEVELALATALIDADRGPEARQVLDAIPEPRPAGWRLRSGLVAFQDRQRAAAQSQFEGLKVESLPEGDRPWYWFLAAALLDTGSPRDVTKANELYRRAENLARTDLARARFQLAGEQVRLRLVGQPNEADLRQAKETADRFAGRAMGYDAARSYAAMLAAANRRPEAVAVLERVVQGLPPQELAARDELRFSLGLIGDRGRGGAGRNALNQLLDNGQNPARQHQALEMLAESSREEPVRAQFRADLDRWIAAQPPHPVLESLWYFRAQFALSDKDFVRAEEDAGNLLRQFPLSPLRAHALGVLMQSAWEQGRYRLAADYARKASADQAPASGTPAVPPLSPRARVDLGVLAAEASYRAGDFRSAADAYAAVLQDRPADLEAARVAELMFQRVLAEIKTGSGEGPKVLDGFVRDPAFDLESRWQAEWSLARALRLEGEAGVRTAYARINTLAAEPAAADGLKPELRARLLWLQAKLAFDSGQAAQTVTLADAYLARTLELPPALGSEISSMVLLLKARAELALARESVALETLRRLRSEFPRTEAAVSSYLIESEHYAAQDKIDEARNRLVRLADNPEYRGSDYVPLALFRLALLSERLGSEENLREANKRIEQLMSLLAGATGEAEQALIFAARLRQGDIHRRRSDFPAAQRAYEELVNRYPQRPDVALAQLALAECHNAQSSGDPSGFHADSAQLLFEQLRDRLNVPLDVRVEAGYNLGALLARRGKPDEAAKVWWRDVVAPFLIGDERPPGQEAKRPYWLARTLLDLGELQEKRGRFEEAKASYRLLLEKRLPFGAALARSRLQQLGAPPSVAP